MPNLFTPSFGKVPVIMAGRGLLIEELVDSFRNDPGDPNWTTILIGAQGSGKTTLLTYMETRVAEQGWVVVRTTATSGMLEDIYEQTLRKSAHLIDGGGDLKLSGVSIAGLGGLQFNRESRDMNWRSRMTDILEELNSRDIGLLIEVDEVNPALPDMEELATVYQHFVTEDRRVAILMAGLPHRVSQLLNGESVSFLRRACQHTLGRIEDYEVAKALEETVEQAGKSFDGDAIDAAVRAIDGFPYMLQLTGWRAWNEAGGADIIDISAVERGVALAEEDLKSRVLRRTLDEASDADLAFLNAMREDASLSTIGDVRERLGQTSGYISTYKKRLLEQGLIEEAGRGKVRFALPLLRDYLPEYMEDAL